MKEFKGTQGEWNVAINGNSVLPDNLFVNAPVREEYGRGRSAICNLYLSNNAVKCITEAKANAQLIAAAPDLLKALQQAKVVLSSYNTDTSIDAWVNANEAIKKALGK